MHGNIGLFLCQKILVRLIALDPVVKIWIQRWKNASLALGPICGFGPLAASVENLKIGERFGLKTKASTHTLTTG